MPLTQFDHYTIRAADAARSARFYERLGLRAQPVDDFDFPMVLMCLGDAVLVHIMEAGPALDAFLARQAPAYREALERRTGNLEHVAFNASGLVEFRAVLKAEGVTWIERTLADYGVHQLMFDDHDGIEIEVNFPLAELPA